MGVPLATTTITVKRYTGALDEPQTATTVATAVRAHISSPSGNEPEGATELVDAVLGCDPVDLTSDCRVTDEKTGLEYSVVWARERRGLGLDHIEAGLHAATVRAGT